MTNQPLPYDVFMQKLRDYEVDALKASPVLVIGNDRECTDRLVQTIQNRGLQALSCPGLGDAQSLLARMAFSLVFCAETVLEGELRSLIQVARSTPVILLARRIEGDACLDANHRGAFDCISCPPDPEETDSILTVALARPAYTNEQQENLWTTQP
jgi:DNA-binding NtrC family response regulator